VPEGNPSWSARDAIHRGLARLSAVERGPEIAVGLATLLVLFLGLYNLDGKSFSLDETTSYYVSGVSWQRLIEIAQGAESGWHSPIHSVALKLWRYVFGDTQAALRGLSVLFAALSIPALYLVARQLTTMRVAVLAAVFLAVNPFLIHYAQVSRTYALAMLLTVVSYWLLLRALKHPSPARWGLWTVASALALYAHLFFGLVLAAQALTVVLSGARGRSLLAPLIAFAAVGVISIPVIVGGALTSGGVVNWIPPIRWQSLTGLVRAWAGSTPIAVAVYVAGAVIGMIWMALQRPRWKWSPLLLLWLLLPPIALAAVSLVKPVFVVRYLIIGLPAFVLVAAIGITSVRGWASIALSALLIMGSGFGVAGWLSGPGPQWREAAEFLQAEGDGADGVVFAGPTRAPIAFQVSQLSSFESMPQQAFPPRAWGWNPYSASKPATVARETLRQCGFDRIWAIARSRTTDRFGNAAVSRILAMAYERERTVHIGAAYIHLMVRNDQACPS
jgi:hypothetical protein